MAFSLVLSWITDRLRRKTQNEITPIEIIVQPRNYEGRSNIEHKELIGSISVFAVEDELQFARLWYSNDNYSVRAAAVLCRPFDDNKREFIEMSELPSGSTVGERSIVTSTTINETFNRSRLSLPQTMSLQNISEQSCLQQIWDRVIHFKRAISKAKRKPQPQSYIHLYLSMMYIFCVSGVHTYTKPQNNVVGIQKCSQWIILKLQLGIFALFAFLSAFQSFCQAKYDVLWFLFEGGLNQFVKFSFNVTSLVTSVYCSYLLCKEWKAVKKMINVMSSYELVLASLTNKPAICVALTSITALLASLMSFIISDIRDFSIEDAMLESSFEMSEDIFLWSYKRLNLSVSKLSEEFGNDLNSTEILLAVVKILRDFAYYLQDGMLWDLILCVVFTLFCWMKLFMRYVIEVIDNVLDKTSEEWRVLQQKRELVWMMYRRIRNVFEAVNNVFDLLLIFFHASNVLRYAFFMENLIYPGNLKPLAYVHLLYNIVKSEIIYIMASRLAHQNKVIRKWLRNWGSQTGKIDVGSTEIDIYTVLDELNEEPLGLGTGDFIINQGFHFGLLGLVSSLFVMLASKKQ